MTLFANKIVLHNLLRLCLNSNYFTHRLHAELLHDQEECVEDALFSQDQVYSALHTVVASCSPSLNSWYLSDQFEPDIRYLNFYLAAEIIFFPLC